MSKRISEAARAATNNEMFRVLGALTDDWRSCGDIAESMGRRRQSFSLPWTLARAADMGLCDFRYVPLAGSQLRPLYRRKQSS